VINHPDGQKHLSTSLLLSPLLSNTTGLWSVLGRLTPHPLLDNVNAQLVLSVFTSAPHFYSYHSVFTEKTDYITAIQKLVCPINFQCPLDFVKAYSKVVVRVAQSVWRLTTGCTVRDRIPVGTRCSTRPDRPWGPPSLL